MNWVLTGAPSTRTADATVKLRPFTSTSAGPWVVKSEAGSKLVMVGRLRSTVTAAGTRISPGSTSRLHPVAPVTAPAAAATQISHLVLVGPRRSFAPGTVASQRTRAAAAQ